MVRLKGQTAFARSSDMLYLVDVVHDGNSDRLAFRSEADVDRFIAFAQTFERRCAPLDDTGVYLLDPRFWSKAQYPDGYKGGVPFLRDESILRMGAALKAAFGLVGTMVPTITIEVGTKGIGFDTFGFPAMEVDWSPPQR